MNGNRWFTIGLWMFNGDDQKLREVCLTWTVQPELPSGMYWLDSGIKWMVFNGTTCQGVLASLQRTRWPSVKTWKDFNWKAQFLFQFRKTPQCIKSRNRSLRLLVACSQMDEDWRKRSPRPLIKRIHSRAAGVLHSFLICTVLVRACIELQSSSGLDSRGGLLLEEPFTAEFSDFRV